MPSLAGMPQKVLLTEMKIGSSIFMAFENDRLAFGSINMAQTFINMALLNNNLAFEKKRHAKSSRHASFCDQLLYFYRVRCLELE